MLRRLLGLSGALLLAACGSWSLADDAATTPTDGPALTSDVLAVVAGEPLRRHRHPSRVSA